MYDAIYLHMTLRHVWMMYSSCVNKSFFLSYEEVVYFYLLF